MKRFACAGLAVATLAGATAPVLAADLPLPAEPVQTYDSTPVPAARFDWTGFYLGGNLGWGWGEFDNSSGPTGSFNSNANGVQGGGHAGYNYAITPNIVTGLEADFQFSDLSKTNFRNGVGVKTSSDWNSSVRGRLGYTFDRFMVYGAGGLAIADLKVNADGAEESTTAFGWTLGAGVEGAVTNNITARVEYAYQDFGRESFTLNGNRYRSDLDANLVRFGLSYKF
ncbi:outer membrane immunogenic protein [Roseibium hamelinense]|uniref:Outer membrane immunogenic protein n=1 Tax=Roseibium hamelinense TaxID=150831 RepID=A0A562SXY7_9HYPH|nr:outer membrane protein [Roseibium hamelinense]MTI43653.1 porin family protein [Roseibium hamelinense]TWI86171.1 outer membrane immunogenic protein [Roseibium hamelinense]